MKKIITLFQRNYETDRKVRNEVVPGAEWVLAGEGIATRKLDGTCCLVRDGKVFKRYEVKPGMDAPANFEAANDLDPETGKQQGWVPVSETDPMDRWHREGWLGLLQHSNPPPDGTYELLGPRVQGNAEEMPFHILQRHADIEPLDDCPRDFDGIKAYLASQNIEGIVWNHEDGRMVKIKGRDFGLKRKK